MLRSAVLFLGLVLISQLAIYPWLPSRLKIRSQIRERIDAEARSGLDIAFLGDSVLRATQPWDSDPANIPEMLQRELGGRRVSRLDHAAYHLGIYLEMVRYLLRLETPPRVIIIPINLHSFSPDWRMAPSNQFVKDRFVLRHAGTLVEPFFKPLFVFRVLDLQPVSEEEQWRTPVHDGTQPIGTLREISAATQEFWRPESVRLALTLRYMGTIREDNPRMHDLVELLELLAGQVGTTCLFYATPINVEAGIRYVGPRFAGQLATNIGILEAVLQAHGHELLDLSMSCPDAWFYADPDRFPNEHMGQHGRLLVASRLARLLNRDSTH